VTIVQNPSACFNMSAFGPLQKFTRTFVASGALIRISTRPVASTRGYSASQTFVDMYKDVCKAGMKESDAKALGSFLTYGLGEGQASLGQLYYAKLPSELLSKSKSAAQSVSCNGSPIGA